MAADKPNTGPPKPGEETDIDRPRLTPQGRTTDGKPDETAPKGGAKQGQGDKAES